MEQQLYNTVLYLAGGSNLLMAFVLLYNNYWFRNYDVYHRASQLVALCYVLFGMGFLLHAYFQLRTVWPDAASALSVSYFHCGAVFFGWSHTSLLKPDYLTRRVAVRDLTILVVGLTAYWTAATHSSLFIIHFSFLIFFTHAGFIAYTFYRTYYRVRRNIADRHLEMCDEGGRHFSLFTFHFSLLLSCHLIVLFGLGSIIVTAVFPHDIWPYTLLSTAGILVFCYIFYAFTEYGNVIESATNATEDALVMKQSENNDKQKS